MQITNVCAVLVLCAIDSIYGGLFGKSSRDSAELLEIVELEPAPELSFCSSYFMGTAYTLRCMISTTDIFITWYKDGVVLPMGNNSDGVTKYQISKDGYKDFRFISLLIYDVSPRDVGQYQVIVRNSYGMAQQDFYVTPIEACDTLMRCFEDTCNWPEKMTCNSIPHARCVVDMCSTRPDEWCMPKWFIGIEEVNCQNEDSYYSNTDQEMP